MERQHISPITLQGLRDKERRVMIHLGRLYTPGEAWDKFDYAGKGEFRNTVIRNLNETNHRGFTGNVSGLLFFLLILFVKRTFTTCKQMTSTFSVLLFFH